MTTQPRLPGTSRAARPKRGPQRRRAEAVARGIDRSPSVELAIGLLYYTADLLDQQAADPDASPFNQTRTVSEHRANAQWLGALTATTSAGIDPFAALVASLTDDTDPAPVRNTPPA